MVWGNRYDISFRKRSRPRRNRPIPRLDPSEEVPDDLTSGSFELLLERGTSWKKRWKSRPKSRKASLENSQKLSLDECVAALDGDRAMAIGWQRKNRNEFKIKFFKVLSFDERQEVQPSTDQRASPWVAIFT